jgi:hypothetical protein
MQPHLESGPKFTAIWQFEIDKEANHDSLRRFFEPFIDNHVQDGKHEVVMDNAIVFDAWVYARDLAYYEEFRGKNAFLVHIGDEFYEIGADRYECFRGVFRSYWSSVFNPKDVMVLPLGCGLPDSTSTIAPASERRYAWSFVGQAGKCSRPEMVRAMSAVEPHISFSTTAVPGLTFWTKGITGSRRIPKSEFLNILRDSAFAPAPMGNANLESFRVYEALDAGTIPIVEKGMFLDYFRRLLGDHPLPTVRTWREARHLVRRYLDDPEALNQLQQECIRWWADYQARLADRIGGFLTERSAAGGQAHPFRSRLPSMPGWNYVELLRHHNAHALRRRAETQFRRLAMQRKWRVATRPGVPPV